MSALVEFIEEFISFWLVFWVWLRYAILYAFFDDTFAELEFILFLERGFFLAVFDLTDIFNKCFL